MEEFTIPRSKHFEFWEQLEYRQNLEVSWCRMLSINKDTALF